MIHAATLVHDDVIDVAQTRRGRPSANVQWGNHTCVLAGDWLYMQAFQMALRERNFHILDLLISLTQMMVEGELIQLDRIGRIDVTEADCMEVVDRKTACLFSACAKLGALSAGADTRRKRSWANSPGTWAWRSSWSTTCWTSPRARQTLGKPVGGDLKEGKVTLPLVYALERASADERRLVELVLADRSYEHVPLRQILGVIEKYHGIERVRERAQAFTDKARHLIGEFPESPYQRALYGITELVTDRDH